MTDDVGYKRPRANRRFLPARSGNPSGRPKRRPSFRAPAKGQRRADSKPWARVKTLVDSAVAGDVRAQSLLVGVLARIGEPEQIEAASPASDDQAILDAYVGGELKRRADQIDTASSPGEDNAADRHCGRHPERAFVNGAFEGRMARLELCDVDFRTRVMALNKETGALLLDAAPFFRAVARVLAARSRPPFLSAWPPRRAVSADTAR